MADRQRRISPFGHFPGRASAIAGLREGDASPEPGYVFHSDYVATRAGRFDFKGRFKGLQATDGRLRVRVRAMPYDGSRIDCVADTELPLADITADGGLWTIAFESAPNHYHAVDAVLVGPTDATASDLTIAFDGWGEGEWHRDALLRARNTSFAGPSAVGKRWWHREGPVDRADLISAEPATLAHPASQMCTNAQFDEPVYEALLAELGMPRHRHRKQWEFLYIIAVLDSMGLLQAGARGLGFGCGMEFLPAYFAKRRCTVVATDMPPEIQEASGWTSTGQHVAQLEQLQRPGICPPRRFQRRVSFRPVDMNAIPDDLTQFDFCWSACALEHLGSIEHGLAFIRRSVECLKPGGVAVHTTELNLSSNDATLDNAGTVLFRRRDMERVALELTRAGHRVLPLKYDQGDQPPDQHVDVPPFGANQHLKLAIAQYVSTSFGIAVIRDGLGA